MQGDILGMGVRQLRIDADANKSNSRDVLT